MSSVFLKRRSFFCLRLLFILAVLTGGDADLFFEIGRELIIIVVAAIFRNFRERQFGMGNLCFGKRQSLLQNIFFRGALQSIDNL